jgi:hypothetical protein
MGIETLDPRNTADVNAVADLHLQFLGDSPIVRLGEDFLRRFFYVKLVADGDVGVTLCRHEGRIIGFISYTRDPLGFIARGARRHLFFLAWLLGTGMLARPALARDVLFTLKMMRERSGEARKAEPGLGEVISLVTVPEFQKHIPEGGKNRLTVRLFEEMVAFFRGQGFDRVHLKVLPHNKASNILCSIMGCQFEKITEAGMTVHRYTYFLNRAAGGPAGA